MIQLLFGKIVCLYPLPKQVTHTPMIKDYLVIQDGTFSTLLDRSSEQSFHLPSSYQCVMNMPLEYQIEKL